jgi:hypothetical protein
MVTSAAVSLVCARAYVCGKGAALLHELSFGCCANSSFSLCLFSITNYKTKNAKTKRAQLNTDIALFRDLNPTNYDDTIGQARCGFEDDTSRAERIPQCPHVEAAVLIGAELKHNNVQFKVRFLHCWHLFRCCSRLPPSLIMIDAPTTYKTNQPQTEFRNVLVKMLANGYERVSCGDEVCQLIKK